MVELVVVELVVVMVVVVVVELRGKMQLISRAHERYLRAGIKWVVAQVKIMRSLNILHWN